MSNGLSTDPIPNFGVDSRGKSAAKNLADWREAVTAFFDIEADPWLFRADGMSYAMGTMLFARARSTAQTFIRTPDTIARSGVDHVLIQLYVEGGFAEVAGTRPIVVEPGDVCVLDLGQTLETQATAFENLTLVMPRAAFENRVTRQELLHGLVLKADGVMAEVVGRHLKTLFELAPRMTFADCECVARGTTGLVIACLRGEIEARAADDLLAPALSILRVRRFIDQNLADPRLSPETIAERFGLSRASLYRLFEPIGGIAAYVRARRLHRAFHELTSRRGHGAKVGEIARKWNFGSESAFTRAFKAAYGLSPSQAHAASRLGPTLARPRARDVAPLTHWMMALAATGEAEG